MLISLLSFTCSHYQKINDCDRHELTFRSNPQKVGHNPQISLKESLTNGKLDLIVTSPLLFFNLCDGFNLFKLAVTFNIP